MPVEDARPVDVVRTGYDVIGDRYHSWSHEDPTRLRFVGELLRRLRPGSTVLELGCGPGDPATRMLAERHRVVGVDVSRGQLELARGHAPTAILAQADITRLAVRPGSVDAVASFLALGHLPSAAHAPLLAAIGSWLRPGGVLVTSAPLGIGDDRDEDWLGVPMFFGGIGEDATVAAVESGGLVVESAERVSDDEGGGNVVTFLWVTARKRGAP